MMCGTGDSCPASDSQPGPLGSDLQSAGVSMETSSAPPSKKAAVASWLWDWAKSIGVALVVWLFLRTFLVEAFHIPSGSMEKTLLVGD